MVIQSITKFQGAYSFKYLPLIALFVAQCQNQDTYVLENINRNFVPIDTTATVILTFNKNIEEADRDKVNIVLAGQQCQVKQIEWNTIRCDLPPQSQSSTFKKDTILIKIQEQSIQVNPEKDLFLVYATPISKKELKPETILIIEQSEIIFMDIEKLDISSLIIKGYFLIADTQPQSIEVEQISIESEGKFYIGFNQNPRTKQFQFIVKDTQKTQNSFLSIIEGDLLLYGQEPQWLSQQFTAVNKQEFCIKQIKNENIKVNDIVRIYSPFGEQQIDNKVIKNENEEICFDTKFNEDIVSFQRNFGKTESQIVFRQEPLLVNRVRSIEFIWKNTQYSNLIALLNDKQQQLKLIGVAFRNQVKSPEIRRFINIDQGQYPVSIYNCLFESVSQSQVIITNNNKDIDIQVSQNFFENTNIKIIFEILYSFSNNIFIQYTDIINSIIYLRGNTITLHANTIITSTKQSTAIEIRTTDVKTSVQIDNTLILGNFKIGLNLFSNIKDSSNFAQIRQVRIYGVRDSAIFLENTHKVNIGDSQLLNSQRYLLVSTNLQHEILQLSIVKSQLHTLGNVFYRLESQLIEKIILANSHYISEQQTSQILELVNLDNKICNYHIPLNVELTQPLTLEGISTPLINNNCIYSVLHAVKTNPKTTETKYQQLYPQFTHIQNTQCIKYSDEYVINRIYCDNIPFIRLQFTVTETQDELIRKCNLTVYSTQSIESKTQITPIQRTFSSEWIIVVQPNDIFYLAYPSGIYIDNLEIKVADSQYLENDQSLLINLLVRRESLTYVIRQNGLVFPSVEGQLTKLGDYQLVSDNSEIEIKIPKSDNVQIFNVISKYCNVDAPTDNCQLPINQYQPDDSTNVFYYHDPQAWASGLVPTDNTDATVVQGKTIILAKSTQLRLKSIKIAGKLIILQSLGQIDISAEQIQIESTGSLLVQAPFAYSQGQISIKSLVGSIDVQGNLVIEGSGKTQILQLAKDSKNNQNILDIGKSNLLRGWRVQDTIQVIDPHFDTSRNQQTKIKEIVRSQVLTTDLLNNDYNIISTKTIKTSFSTQPYILSLSRSINIQLKTNLSIQTKGYISIKHINITGDINIDNQGTQEINIQQNVISKCNQSCLELKGNKYVVEQNIIRDSQNYGIKLENAEDVLIKHSIILNVCQNQKSDNGCSGIYIGQTNRVSVTQNVIYNSNKNGLNIQLLSTNSVTNIYTQNIINGATKCLVAGSEINSQKYNGDSLNQLLSNLQLSNCQETAVSLKLLKGQFSIDKIFIQNSCQGVTGEAKSEENTQILLTNGLINLQRNQCKQISGVQLELKSSETQDKKILGSYTTVKLQTVELILRECNNQENNLSWGSFTYDKNIVFGDRYIFDEVKINTTESCYNRFLDKFIWKDQAGNSFDGQNFIVSKDQPAKFEISDTSGTLTPNTTEQNSIALYLGFDEYTSSFQKKNCQKLNEKHIIECKLKPRDLNNLIYIEGIGLKKDTVYQIKVNDFENIKMKLDQEGSQSTKYISESLNLDQDTKLLQDTAGSLFIVNSTSVNLGFPENFPDRFRLKAADEKSGGYVSVRVSGIEKRGFIGLYNNVTQFIRSKIHYRTLVPVDTCGYLHYGLNLKSLTFNLNYRLDCVIDLVLKHAVVFNIIIKEKQTDYFGHENLDIFDNTVAGLFKNDDIVLYNLGGYKLSSVFSYAILYDSNDTALNKLEELKKLKNIQIDNFNGEIQDVKFVQKTHHIDYIIPVPEPEKKQKKQEGLGTLNIILIVIGSLLLLAAIVAGVIYRDKIKAIFSRQHRRDSKLPLVQSIEPHGSTIQKASIGFGEERNDD